MEGEDTPERQVTRLGRKADEVFLHVELAAYVALGLLLAAAAVRGMLGAGAELLRALPAHGPEGALILAIDRLLFVLMVVEILHTVRASFRSGTLVSEPFLVVGLIASIRRVLVITLESSEANEPGRMTAESMTMLHSALLELLVLAVLILVMVASIYLLRRSKRPPAS
jgi:phosphate starvation-inducible membrane PsiE